MEDILYNVNEIGKVSNDQEKNRSSSLLTKTDYLIKYISVTFIFTNAVFVFLSANKIIDNLFILAIIYICIASLLCFSLHTAVKAQILKDVSYFPTGNQEVEILRQFYSKNKKLPNKVDLTTKFINYYSEYTDSLIHANKERSKLINKAYRIYLSSILVISVGFIIILFIIA